MMSPHSNNCCVVHEPAICEDLDLHVAIFNNSPIEGITPIKHALVLQKSNMHKIFTGVQVFQMLEWHYPIYGSHFN